MLNIHEKKVWLNSVQFVVIFFGFLYHSFHTQCIASLGHLYNIQCEPPKDAFSSHSALSPENPDLLLDLLPTDGTVRWSFRSCSIVLHDRTVLLAAPLTQHQVSTR